MGSTLAGNEFSADVMTRLPVGAFLLVVHLCHTPFSEWRTNALGLQEEGSIQVLHPPYHFSAGQGPLHNPPHMHLEELLRFLWLGNVGNRGGGFQVEPWTMNSGVHLGTCEQGVQFEKSVGVGWLEL